MSIQELFLHPKRKEAEFHDGQTGTVEITNTDPWGGGSKALRVDAGGHIIFNGRNLLNIDGVRYRVASASGGGTIELRLDGPSGTLLSSTAVPVTGGTTIWTDVESSITDPGGKHDLYMVFTGSGQSIFDLNYVEFLGTGISVDNSPPMVEGIESTTPTEVSVEFSEYISTPTVESIGNYTLDNGATVLSAALQSDGRTVLLTTSLLSPNTGYYVLTVSGVENLAGLPIVTGGYSFSTFDAVRLNSGGPEVTVGSDTFMAGQYNDGGVNYTNAIAIEDTTDDTLYQSERFGSFSYEIPISVADTYDIRLHFAEIYFGVPGNGSSGGEGSRVFDVFIEGNLVLDNFDILSETAPATALVKEFDDVDISDGFATITLISEVENPKISGIEVLPSDSFSPIPSIAILSPSNAANVNDPFDVHFAVENWDIGVGSTHMHYFIDGLMIGPHYSYGPVEISGLAPGPHTIRLELYTPSHTGTGVYDEVIVNVTDQVACNSTDFPDGWQAGFLDDEELAHRATYILPNADINGDGLRDVVTGGWWYLNPGTISGEWEQNTIGTLFDNVAYIYDFDDDGDMDLFGSTTDYDNYAPQYDGYVGTELVWAENDGSGNFTVHTNIPAGTSTYWEPFISDITGDFFNAGSDFQLAISWNGGEIGRSEVQ
ncbi:MAG: malectin domain-containing carbohydrate-binding protein, partial [Hyphomicrobiales bacterium]